jgi:hypothetical protein
MSETEDRDPAQARDSGMLGGLPRRRPAVPSPRRRPSREGSTPAKETPAEDHAATTGAGEGGLEDLAKAGVALATGAAAAGLKLAGRTLDGIRGAVERR